MTTDGNCTTSFTSLSDSIRQAGNGAQRRATDVSIHRHDGIWGARDAVLVDPPMTNAQAAQVINWVEASGKTLKHIFITHGHGDHWFGAGPLLKRFPDVTVFAAPGTIEVMQYHASPEVRAAVWNKSFPGQIPEASVVATTPPDNTFDLEGSELRIVEVGHTDTDTTTVLYVPSIGLVVAGDAVYNGVHQYPAGS